MRPGGWGAEEGKPLALPQRHNTTYPAPLPLSHTRAPIGRCWGVLVLAGEVGWGGDVVCVQLSDDRVLGCPV